MTGLGRIVDAVGEEPMHRIGEKIHAIATCRVLYCCRETGSVMDL